MPILQIFDFLAFSILSMRWSQISSGGSSVVCSSSKISFNVSRREIAYINKNGLYIGGKKWEAATASRDIVVLVGFIHNRLYNCTRSHHVFNFNNSVRVTSKVFPVINDVLYSKPRQYWFNEAKVVAKGTVELTRYRGSVNKMQYFKKSSNANNIDLNWVLVKYP